MNKPEVRLNSICDGRDWDHLTFREWESVWLRPSSFQNRKRWEVIQVGRVVHLLPLGGDGERLLAGRALGLGVGREVLLYDFANHCHLVVGLDLYPNIDLAKCYSQQGGRPIAKLRAYTPLVLMREDMRNLKSLFPENHFDFVWSCCAIEHLDSVQEVKDLLCSVYHVLRPEGVFAFTTEWVVRGPMERHAGFIPFAWDSFDWITDAGFRFLEYDESVRALRVKDRFVQRSDTKDEHPWNTPKFPGTRDDHCLHVCWQSGIVTSASFVLRKPTKEDQE